MTKSLPEIEEVSGIIAEYIQVYEVWKKDNSLLKEVFDTKKSDLVSLDHLIGVRKEAIEKGKEAKKKFDQ